MQMFHFKVFLETKASVFFLVEVSLGKNQSLKQNITKSKNKVKNTEIETVTQF